VVEHRAKGFTPAAYVHLPGATTGESV